VDPALLVARAVAADVLAEHELPSELRGKLAPEIA